MKTELPHRYTVRAKDDRWPKLPGLPPMNADRQTMIAWFEECGRVFEERDALRAARKDV